MIIVQRKTGVILHADPLTEEQRIQMWEKFLEVAAPPLIKKMMEAQMQEAEDEMETDTDCDRTEEC